MSLKNRNGITSEFLEEIIIYDGVLIINFYRIKILNLKWSFLYVLTCNVGSFSLYKNNKVCKMHVTLFH